MIKAGHRYRSPRLLVFAGTSFETPCGPARGDGYYCGSSETIYLNATKAISNYRQFDPVWTRADMAFTIAHEYGHHVQQMTGIMRASWDRQYELNGQSAKLEENRRRELQASCFSAVYLGADKTYFPVSGRFAYWWRWAMANRGDQWNPVRDHGDKKWHSWWSLRGFNSKNPGLCNTYTASSSVVS